ncbi:MAG: hypothetical protein WBV22_13150 [Anaerolineaceae bacterium]
MQTPLDQIFTILDSIPASLGIYLLSSVLLLIGLVMTVSYWPQIPASISRRLAFGLLLMLLVELLAFSLTMLLNNNPQSSLTWLPPMDRFQMAFIQLWLLWIWAFPTHSNWADYLVGIISFGLLVAFGATMSVWTTAFQQTGFNAHWLDLTWQLSCLGFQVVMLIFIYAKRPRLWGIGVMTCLLYIIGEVIQLAMPALSGNYAGPVRLVTLVALPLLLLLPQRFISPANVIHAAEQRRGEDKSIRRRYSTELGTALGFLSLAWEDNPREAMQQLVKSIGQTLMADICLFVTQPDRNGQVTVLIGFDFLHQTYIDEVAIARDDIPQVVDALSIGRNLRLPEDHTATPDTTTLCKLIKHEGSSSVLAHPVTIPNAWQVGGIILLSPFSHRAWVPEDSVYISGLVEPLIRIIEHNQAQLDTHTRYQKMTDDLRDSGQHISNLQTELQKLSVQLDTLNLQKAAKKADTDKLEPLVIAMTEAEQKVASLAAENDNLRKQVATMKGISEDEYQLHENQLEKELHLSLEEVARLKNILADADMKTRQLERELKARS